MRILLRLVGIAALVAVLAIAVLIGDFAYNGHRLFYAALGRDALVEACRPAVNAKLRAAGFEPDDIIFGDEPDIAVSTWAGRSLTDTLTFEDGASRTRVDGVVSCAVQGSTITVTVQTSSAPLRAT